MYRRGGGQSLGGSPGARNGPSKRSPALSRGWGRHWRLASVLGLCALGTLLVTFLLGRSGPQDTPLLTDMEGQPTPAFCSRGRPPLVCAHGGDIRHLPPNTMQAFQAALDIGVDCVEVDVALTRDGELVVLHIREFQQLMGKQYKPGMQVGDVSWAELQSLSWPGGQKVMRVREAVLQTSPFVDCVTLDVKTYQDRLGQAVDEDLLVEALTRLVHETGCHNCIIWAKSDKIVAGVARLSPGQRTGYILMNQTQQVREEGMDQPLRMEAPDVVGAYYGMVDPALVQLLHAHHKQLYAWTVNDPESMRSMLDAGVDALVTNHPLMAIQAIEWRTARCGGVGRDGSSPWSAPKQRTDLR